MRSLLVLPALALPLLAGCSLSDDGEQTTQSRNVPAFTRVANADSVDVKLHAGTKAQPLRVRAGDKVIDDVRTEVRDGTLHVTFDDSGWGISDVQVEAWTAELTAIDSDGSGDVKADGVSGDAFQVTADGSADVRVRGTTDRLVVAVDGSGDAKLGDLAAGEARVKAGGSGDVEVRADERLDVDADGSGDVRYHGTPQLTKRVDGSGDVKAAG